MVWIALCCIWQDAREEEGKELGRSRNGIMVMVMVKVMEGNGGL